ncbi:hypothetical protein [Clostridium sp.]|uniref:hypothetical protein n=1 Tax=Clostridium sp. TaxID=1506 RepID=UPI00260BDC34|nr:hypothetical protein [Clostridium sp.]
MEKKFDALKTANEYIDNLKLGIEDLVGKINSGQENNAMLLIAEIADGLEWLINVVTLTVELHKGDISIESLKEKLEEVIEALENEDYVLTGDLFNYEILPILEEIQNNIRSIFVINKLK